MGSVRMRMSVCLLAAAVLAFPAARAAAQPGMQFTAQDRALADAMGTYWTSFAKTGNPNGAGVPSWPAFTARRPAVMHFDSGPEVGPVLNLEKLEVLEGYYAWRRAQAPGKP